MRATSCSDADGAAFKAFLTKTVQGGAVTGTVDQSLRKANAFARKGAVDEAQRLYAQVLARFPNNKRAKTGLASLRGVGAAPSPAADALSNLVALHRAGRYPEAERLAQTLVKDAPGSYVIWSVLGSSRAAQQNVKGAVEAFQRARDCAPDRVEAFANLANAHRQAGDLAAAAEVFEQALRRAPRSVDLWCALGQTQQAMQAWDAACGAFEQATALAPSNVQAWFGLGTAHLKAERPEPAVKAFDRALALQPGLVEARVNLGQARKEMGQLDAALDAYAAALALRPEDATIHVNIGNALQEKRDFPGAVAAFEQALRLEPSHVLALYNLGKARFACGEWEQAVEAFSAAVAQDPLHAKAQNSLGTALHQAGDLDAALSSYRRAASLDPQMAEAHANIGVICQEQGARAEAVQAFGRALAIRPDMVEVEAQLLHQRAQMCDWTDFEAQQAACARLGLTGRSVPTFTMLSAEDNPSRQLQRARLWASEKFNDPAAMAPACPSCRPGRLRLGYFTADFRDHPVMHLISGLLRSHDRAAFDVQVFGYGGESQGALARAVRHDLDGFHEVSNLTDDEVAALARAEGLDIAIDLTGYTQKTRTSAFQRRLAPVQISFLGYPGTLGAEFMDYMIADAVVIPRAQRAHYDEKLIYLPNSFQPNDDQRGISATQTTRGTFGLSDDSVVLCCFNNAFKITPAEWDIWIRVLHDVPDAVLWLAKPNDWAVDNLRRAVKERGVAPDRLIFADRVAEYGAHLARLRHADLFLDTFNYNAHTTASDALWAGLPLITKCGDQFAARVAASVLCAVGLSDLVTETPEAYQSKITELASNPDQLVALRSRLAENRQQAPLFDTLRYTRAFEAGLSQAYDRFWAGAAPDDIWVTEETAVPDPN